MAVPSSLPELLGSLSQSLNLALETTPKLAGIEPPKNGLSLLDVKNELLLSYLQDLVFLILVKLRQSRHGAQKTRTDSDKGISDMGDAVVNRLVQLRLYLEKGVRPLEDKLRYQIEKVLRAADDSEQNEMATQSPASKRQSKKSTDSASGSGSESDEEEASDEDEEAAQAAGISDLQHRPNLSAFVRPEAAARTSKDTDAAGVYRPPRIAPTVMPTTERRERAERRPAKSATLDEFIADEMAAAPLAEPSIGTTIAAGGRKMKSKAERAEEAERLEYEERNFVRLPKESKKDRAKKSRLEGRGGRMNFGGEEWHDLGQGIDRINTLTKGKSGGTGTKALLEKSRKRGRETVDGPRASGSSNGVQMGERYQKRLKVLEGGRRDRGNKR